MGRTFSGEATADPVALDLVLQDARGVRITARGCLVYAVDRDADVLDAATEKHVVLMQDEPMVHVEVVDELAELRRLLVVGEFDNFMCMCAGDLALEFLDSEGERVTVVRFDKPGWVTGLCGQGGHGYAMWKPCRAGFEREASIPPMSWTVTAKCRYRRTTWFWSVTS